MRPFLPPEVHPPQPRAVCSLGRAVWGLLSRASSAPPAAAISDLVLVRFNDSGLSLDILLDFLLLFLLLQRVRVLCTMAGDCAGLIAAGIITSITVAECVTTYAASTVTPPEITYAHRYLILRKRNEVEECADRIHLRPSIVELYPSDDWRRVTRRYDWMGGERAGGRAQRV